MRARPLLTAALLSLSLAGCMGKGAPDPGPASAETPPGGADPAVLPDLGLAGIGCEEGGGHSVHPIMFNPLPEPWTPADVLDDVGPQWTYSEIPEPTRPVPEKGRTMGNYHATIRCEAWTLDGNEKRDLLFGFVGMKVLPPPFGEPGPTHEYLVTVIATNDDDLHARLAAAGFHPMKSTASWETLPAGALRIRMGTDHNGNYDSIFKPREFGEMKATHVRLWYQQPNEDGTFTPVALDLHAAGGNHSVAEAQGYFSHSGTHHHDPAPGAYGHTAAILYEGFDRTYRWGPRPDVKLAEAYEH